MNINEELAAYLSNTAFKRFVEAWIKKYQSLGHLGGSILLKNLTIDEQETLGLFLGKDLTSGSLYLSYSQFSKILSTTKYEDIDFLEVLRLLEPMLVSNSDLKLKKDAEIETFKQEVMNAVKDNSWLKHYFSTDLSFRKFLPCKEDLINIANCLDYLPVYTNTQEMLPVFSQKYTGNPHYFDSGLFRDTLLKGICFKLTLEPTFNNAKEINNIFLNAGLIKDTLSNYCVVYHIKGSNKIYQWFYDQYEPWNLNYNNILMMDNIFSKQKVYILENPSVFSYLANVVKENKLDVGLVLSNGQINLCTYALLDQLVEQHASLYYAGDFDPEGLLIADKLKQRYKEHLHLWCYEREHFESIRTEINVSERRLEMLKQLKDEKLVFIGTMIKNSKCIGYQEGLIKIYESYLIELNEN